jgi:hypothetical protein
MLGVTSIWSSGPQTYSQEAKVHWVLSGLGELDVAPKSPLFTSGSS